MILAIAAEKGGVGKTTLSVNLAVWRARQGRRVLLIDADKKQASASSWLALRMRAELEPSLTCTMLEGDMVSSQVKAMAPLFDDVVIDGRGANDKGLLGSLVIANRCLTPVWPGQFDLGSLVNMVEMLELARQVNPDLDALTVISRALTNDRDNDAKKAQDQIRKDIKGYRLVETIIHGRKAWNHCSESGTSVLEQHPIDAAAAAELDALAEEVWK
jgi:chromosome partitioning protein